MTGKLFILALFLLLLVPLSACQPINVAAAAAEPVSIPATATPAPTQTLPPPPTQTIIPTAMPTAGPTVFPGVDFRLALGKDPQSFADDQLADLLPAPDPRTQPQEHAAWVRGYLAVLSEALQTYPGVYIVPGEGRGEGANGMTYEFLNRNMRVLASYKIPFGADQWAVVKTYPVKDSQGQVSTISMIFTPDSEMHVNGKINNFMIPANFVGFRVYYAASEALFAYVPSSASYLPRPGFENQLKTFFETGSIAEGLESQALMASGAD